MLVNLIISFLGLVLLSLSVIFPKTTEGRRFDYGWTPTYLIIALIFLNIIYIVVVMVIGWVNLYKKYRKLYKKKKSKTKKTPSFFESQIDTSP